MEQATNVGQIGQATPQQEKQQTQTGWLNWLGGGKREKRAAVAQAAVDRSFQVQQAAVNRQFQERLSSSAYQRAVADMKKAGLNPAMMYQGMSGASTPSGSTPSGRGTASTGGEGMGLLTTALQVASAILTKGVSLGATAATAGTSAGARVASSAIGAKQSSAGKMSDTFIKALKHKENKGKMPDWYTYGT